MKRKTDQLSQNRVSNIEYLQEQHTDQTNSRHFDMASYQNRMARDEEIIRMESILADQRNRLNEY
jgi:hypothetical protein